jgi:serine protease Do
MTVTRWGALAGAMVVLAGAGAPARVSAQSRALEIVGRGAHIGVTVEDLEGDDAKQRGVRIETVTPDGPADKAGLKAGDTISEFDGERVRSMLHFSRLVQETPPGRAVPVTLTRGGQRLNVTITPDRRSWSDDFGVRLLDVPRGRVTPMPTPPTPPRAPRPPAMVLPEVFDSPGLFRFSSGRRLGVTIEGLDDQLAQYFGVKEGVLVKSVEEGSAAQKAGIKAGDVLTAINGSKVYDTSDVNRVVNRIDEAGEFTVEIVRDKKTQTMKGKLEARDARRPRARTIL